MSDVPQASATRRTRSMEHTAHAPTPRSLDDGGVYLTDVKRVDRLRRAHRSRCRRSKPCRPSPARLQPRRQPIRLPRTSRPSRPRSKLACGIAVAPQLFPDAARSGEAHGRAGRNSTGYVRPGAQPRVRGTWPRAIRSGRPRRSPRSHRDRSKLCSILKASGFEVFVP